MRGSELAQECLLIDFCELGEEPSGSSTAWNNLLDLHAAERDSWHACCSLCVPTVLATPDAAPPSPANLSVSVRLTTYYPCH
jgi:hypothetical protein